MNRNSMLLFHRRVGSGAVFGVFVACFVAMLGGGCGKTTKKSDEYSVIRVIDGDTFTVWYDDEETSVRVYGVDTPERGEPGFDEATAALKEIIGSNKVRLEYPEKHKRDNFGRLLARVYVDGQDIAEAMQEYAKP